MKTIDVVLGITVSTGLLFTSCTKQDSKPLGQDTSAARQTSAQPTVSHPQYATRLKIAPSMPEAKQKITVALVTRDTSTPPVAPIFELTEGTPFNTITVNDDLSYFYQVPANKASDSEYTVNIVPPEGGNYTVFSDYTPKGALQVVNKNVFSVKGKTGVTTEDSLDKWKSTTDNFTVEIKPTAGKFISGVLTMISGAISQKGKPIDESRLQNIMGEKSHIYLIGRNTKEYIHLNLEFDKDAFMFHVFFQKPDVYKSWIQIKVDDKIRTFPLTFVVAQGSKEEIDRVNEAHSKEHTGVKGETEENHH